MSRHFQTKGTAEERVAKIKTAPDALKRLKVLAGQVDTHEYIISQEEIILRLINKQLEMIKEIFPSLLAEMPDGPKKDKCLEDFNYFWS